MLLAVGKEHLHVWEKEDGKIHENDAARILCDLCKSENMKPSEIKEGKIELIATCNGVLKVGHEKINRVNALGKMMIASR